MEIWKDITGYEGIYQISNYGNVKSNDRYVTRKNNTKALSKGKILKPLKNKAGYLFVCLYKENKSKFHYIHRLVAIEFIPNPYSKETVNHINPIKTNNNFENLEWSTQSENNKHSYDNKLNVAIGKDNGNVKLTEEKVLEIRNAVGKQKEIAQIYNIDRSVVSRIKNNKTWSHI